MSARFLGEEEFRQPLVAASPAKPVEMPDPQPQAVADRVVTPVPVSTTVEIEEATDASHSSSPTLPAVESATQHAGGSEQEPSIVGDQVEGRGHDSADNSYVAALREVIRSKWIRHSKQAAACSVTIKQTPGGTVISATSKSCMLSDADRQALEAATVAAQPLPYAGYEQAFREHLTIEMEE